MVQTFTYILIFDIRVYELIPSSAGDATALAADRTRRGRLGEARQQRLVGAMTHGINPPEK
jgi:hypothetical protein